MGGAKDFSELRSQMDENRLARSQERAQKMLDNIEDKRLKQDILEGPNLEDVDLGRDQSPMRDVDLRAHQSANNPGCTAWPGSKYTGGPAITNQSLR